MNQPDIIRGTTPKGIAKWPKLNEPDTKFCKAGDRGKFSVKLLLDPAAAQKVIEEIDALYAENLEYQCAVNNKKPDKIKKADLPYRMEEDKDTGEETGKMEMTFSMKAGGVSNKTGKPWSRDPVLLDKYGRPLKAEIGGGSKIQVAYELNPYYTGSLGAGVSLRLRGVMVHDLKQWTETPESLGFDVEEMEDAQDDGYEMVTDNGGDY